jgi:tetratricopeptide (TPR) repeat protein
LRRYDEAIARLAVAERSDSEEAAQGFRLVGESKEAAETELLAERGRLAADREDHSQAVVYLEEAIAKSPLDWRIRYQLALSQRQVGKLSEARENMERVDQTKEALATCDRLFDVLKDEPENVPARLQIGKVFLRYVSENQGLVWLNSVLELDGSNVEAHRLTAEYLESHLDEHPEYRELAKKHRERVRRADPVSGTRED